MNNFIQNSIYHHNWVVPRSVMCTLFWTGVILVFTGMILLVTSKHKGKMYESWGGVLLGLGLCILLVCLILCIHAYCVMAADASDEEGSSDPADKSNPSSSDGRSSTAAANLKPTTPNTGGSYSGSSLVNGRKPRSIAELIPPPKFGVNVTKPPTHTVRFFLSNDVISSNNSGPDETESVEIDADKTLKTKTTALETTTDRQKAVYPSAPPPPAYAIQTHNGGRKISFPSTISQGRSAVVESNFLEVAGGPFAADRGKMNSVDLRINSDNNNRSLDRNMISSDCDSVMSVETIIQRTLRRDAVEQARSPSSTYDFPDNDDDDDDQTTNKVHHADKETDEVRSLPTSAKRIGKPFPVPSQSSHSSSSTARGGSQGKSLPVSRQTPRHSHAKPHQPQQPYSSDASLSPGSPELTENLQMHDRVSSTAATEQRPPYARQSTAKQMAIPVVKPTTPASHHHHNPDPMIGGLSITRSFGPSSVTVTPLGTGHEASRAATAGHRRHAADDVGLHGHVRSEGAYHRHPLGSMPMQEEEELVERSTIRDAGTAWMRSTKHEQKRRPIDDGDDDDDDRKCYLTSDDLPLGNRYQQLPRPPSNPLLLEITESKATVYDNVQYFQM